MSETEKDRPEDNPQEIVASESDAASGESQAETTDEAVTEPAKPETRQQQSSGGKFVLLLVLILFGLIGAGGWYGYQWLMKTQDSFAELEQNQQSLLRENSDFASRMQSELASIQKSQSELTSFIEVMREQNQHLRKDWLVMEAEYLIQLANYRLLFERDVSTASVALDAADARLKETGDPALLPVRKAIASAIQALKQVDQADLAGLSLTLSSLGKELDKLPLTMPDPKSRAGQGNEIGMQSNTVKSWSELPAAIWQDLKNLIVIRDHEQPVAPLLTPEQRFFLVENLRLQLEQARLAMLSGQGDIYKERIQTAKQWIEQHFDKQAALTQSALETLGQLEHASVSPKLPDISFTYQAIQNYKNATDTKQPASPSPAVESGEGAGQ